jgi:signal-transduction protein with cAMP-binding, CBS, and nucleotidyltransferase domain
MTCQVAEYIRETPPLVDEETKVLEVVRQMSECHVGSAVVTRGGEVVGLFTEGDLMNRVVKVGLEPAGLAVGEVCSRQLISVQADASCSAAVLKMHANGCLRLLVYRGPQYLGLVKIQDLALAMATASRQSSRISDVVVGATLMLVLGVIGMLLLQLPQMLTIAEHVSGQ